MPDPPRRGRPPLDRNDDSVVVSVAMPGRTYDVIYRRAQLERLTVPEVIRRVLRRLTSGDDPPTT
jgi:hypothetical protein